MPPVGIAVAGGGWRRAHLECQEGRALWRRLRARRSEGRVESARHLDVRRQRHPVGRIGDRHRKLLIDRDRCGVRGRVEVEGLRSRREPLQAPERERLGEAVVGGNEVHVVGRARHRGHVGHRRRCRGERRLALTTLNREEVERRRVTTGFESQREHAGIHRRWELRDGQLDNHQSMARAGSVAVGGRRPRDAGDL